MSLTKYLIRYDKLLINRPFLTRAITGAIIVSSGDLLSQFLIEKNGFSNYSY